MMANGLCSGGRIIDCLKANRLGSRHNGYGVDQQAEHGISQADYWEYRHRLSVEMMSRFVEASVVIRAWT